MITLLSELSVHQNSSNLIVILLLHSKGNVVKKLCLTPKYLSKVIKKNSGISANEWINNYITLEAKALLKSTNMSIQQISDELNFPS
jgi:AraC-like DNA-binding protein